MRKFTHTEQINSLSNAVVVSSISITTNRDGNRNRQSSGIFLSQIPIINGLGLLGLTHSLAEFAVRLICGNKPSNRANNASRSLSVVETLSHLLGDISYLLTKTEKIKMTYQPSGNTAQRPSIALSLATQGGNNA